MRAFSDDTPYAFRRAQVLMERAETKRKLQKEFKKNGGADEKIKETNGSYAATGNDEKKGIRPGETMRAYRERVDMELQSDLNKVMKESSDFGAKRKEK
jgi:hypothetical protein